MKEHEHPHWSGKELARHVDDKGYGVSIREEKHPKMLVEHKGTIYIHHPNNKEKLRAGAWMDWPEKNWKTSKEEYKKLPPHERAKLEARQQATSYKPLDQKWKEAKKTNKLDEKSKIPATHDFSKT